MMPDKSIDIIYSDAKKLLGEKLVILRKRKGLTQFDLSVIIEMSPGYVGDIERGALNPTLETLLKIMMAVGCHPGELIPDPHQFLSDPPEQV